MLLRRADGDDERARRCAIDAERVLHDDTATLVAQRYAHAVGPVRDLAAPGVAPVPHQAGFEGPIRRHPDAGPELGDDVPRRVEHRNVDRVGALEPKAHALAVVATVAVG